MPIVQFDERDFLRGKIVQPAWYDVRIDEVGEKTSSDGGSINYPTEGTILRNSDDGTEDFAGVPIVWNFNSKARGFMLGFLASMGIEPKPGQRVEMGGTVGHVVSMYIENKTYEGRILNAVNHKYRPVRTEQV